MPASLQDYKGKPYLLADFSNQSSADCIATVAALESLVRRQSGKVRILSDMTNAAIGPEVMAKAKEAGKTVFQPRSEKQAMIGIDGLKRMLLQAYMKFTGSNIRVFGSRAEALEWFAAE
jgi:hypothetical protein